MAHPGGPHRRIGHDERQQAIDALNEHFTKGRLDVGEFEERIGRASEARTAGDADPLFADLPAPHPTFLMPTPVIPPMPPETPVPAHPASPVQQSDKSKVVAGVLQIVLPFGVGRFYTGHTGIAVAQLVLFFCGIGALWSIVDGIVLLVGDSTDGYGRPLRS